jgi:hypothetical protein
MVAWRSAAWLLPISYLIPVAILGFLLTNPNVFVIAIAAILGDLLLLLVVAIAAVILAQKGRYGPALVLVASICALELSPLFGPHAFNPLSDFVRPLSIAADDTNLAVIVGIPGGVAAALALGGLPLLRHTSRLTAGAVVVLLVIPALSFTTAQIYRAQTP